MNITVLGASGGEAPGMSLTGFKIGYDLLLDAGTIGHRLSLEEQLAIKHILITHAHLDHIHALPFLLDNLIGRVSEPVKVYSCPEIIETIKSSIFNNKIWPDFTMLPTPENPVLRFCPISPGQPFTAGACTVEAVEVNHSFKALAYLVGEKGHTVVFTGDTGPVDTLWERVQTVEGLKAVFMECSFPAAQQAMATMTKHLCVADIVPELQKAKLDPLVPIYLYHLKPTYAEAIRSEATALQSHPIRMLSAGETIELE